MEEEEKREEGRRKKGKKGRREGMKGRRKGRRKEEEGNDGFGSRFHRFQSTGLVCMNLKPWTGGGLRQGEHAADKGPVQPVPPTVPTSLVLRKRRRLRTSPCA